MSGDRRPEARGGPEPPRPAVQLSLLADPPQATLPAGGPEALAAYDLVLLNTSAGKDSSAMLDVVVARADAEGCPRERLVAVHADLGEVEWPGTPALARRQAEHYGLRFELTRRERTDPQTGVRGPDTILDLVARRGMWPSSRVRYCTSEAKRGPLLVLLTRLVAELGLPRPARVLSCMGLRAAESPARSKLVPFAPDERATGGGRRRVVDRWLPIFAWREDEVWARIHAAGLPIHDAYVVHGMPRLSCALCVFASRAALVKAARANPDLAARYAALEARTGHRFRKDLAIAAVVAEAEAGGEVGPIEGWAA